MNGKEMETLLIEIGTEEIPAGYIRPALEGFSALLLQGLDQSRIEHGDVRRFGTPRRLALAVEGVAARQKPLVTEVLGPPERIGLDADGNFTVAARKFAEKIGVALGRVNVTQTPKGSYLSARKTERGQATRTLLALDLPRIILAIPFPKTMKWGELKMSFARPIHSILALLGDRVVSFQLGNVRSGRYTFGHRFVGPARIRLSDPHEYLNALRSGGVMADMAERRALLEKEIQRAAAAGGGAVLPDADLIDIVTNLVEFPAAVLGRFDDKFLELPGEILITAMREHQKYFAVVDGHRRLMPCFVAVNNTPAKDIGLVAKGHERVLRARLSDARFFFESDLKESPDAWVEKLRGVLFQAELGTVHAKVLRLVRLVDFLADQNGEDAHSREQMQRAAFLCKADLVSHVVGEFPKLQGVMGKVYARRAGESESVAAAIAEHYQPTYSGGPLPESNAGALLGIADKIDTICGCFQVGLIPTGASDPYALRRQGIGIIQIMLARDLHLPLQCLIEKSLELFADRRAADGAPTVVRVTAFLRDRIAHMLSEEGFAKDVIAAVVSVSVEDVPNVWERVRALQLLKSEPDFEPLAIAFKRVVNIIKQAGRSSANPAGAAVDPELFEHACEGALYAAYQEVKAKVREDLSRGNFRAALLEIASLRSAVDAFFDGVLVMAEEKRLRANRLALLGQIDALFGEFADFSRISA